MPNINEVSCTELFSNTGFGQCTFAPREIFGFLIVHPDFVIKNSDMGNLQAFLKTASTNPVKGLRLRPVMGFVGATDSSEEAVRATLGYGATKTIRDGNYNWLFQFVNGGTCLLNSLRKINGQTPYVIFVDKAYNLIGTLRDGGLAGIPTTDYWANPWGLNDGSGNPTNLGVYLSFDPTYVNERLSFIQTATIPNFDISVIRGVQDINLEVLTASASAITLQLRDKCTGSTDFGEIYKVELVDKANWVAVTTAGVAQVIDSVTYNAPTRVYTVNFDPDRAGASLLNLAPINVLEADGIVGYEGVQKSVPLTV